MPIMLNIFPDKQVPISLAFLDENNNADNIFYKDHPHDQLRVYISRSGILMTSLSLVRFSLLIQLFAHRLRDFWSIAHNPWRAILYYDVNFRSQHKDEINEDLLQISLRTLNLLIIVRGSHERFRDTI